MLTKYTGALVGTGMALLVAVGPTALAEEPRTLKIAGILSAGKEAPWETSFVDSMNRVVAARPHGLEIDPGRTTYFVGREKLIPSGQSGMARWREILFAFMSQNAHSATTYFRIPPGQVVELGAQVPL